MPDTADGNGRVTLAVIGRDLVHVIEQLQEIKSDQKRLIESVTTHTEQIENHECEINRLRNTSTGWNIVNSLAVALAAWWGGTR